MQYFILSHQPSLAKQKSLDFYFWQAGNCISWCFVQVQKPHNENLGQHWLGLSPKVLPGVWEHLTSPKARRMAAWGNLPALGSLRKNFLEITSSKFCFKKGNLFPTHFGMTGLWLRGCRARLRCTGQLV